MVLSPSKGRKTTKTVSNPCSTYVHTHKQTLKNPDNSLYRVPLVTPRAGSTWPFIQVSPWNTWHFQLCSDARIRIPKAGSQPCCLLTTPLTSLTFSSSSSSSSLFLYNFGFSWAYHCLQQLLSFTYLGSPLTHCLLALHIISRAAGQTPGPTPKKPCPHWLGTPPRQPTPSTGDLSFLSDSHTMLILPQYNSKYDLRFW